MASCTKENDCSVKQRPDSLDAMKSCHEGAFQEQFVELVHQHDLIFVWELIEPLRCNDSDAFINQSDQFHGLQFEPLIRFNDGHLLPKAAIVLG